MSGDYMLEMKGISKAFPGVIALQNVNICVRPGEVHALMGENGAGKSTLMKVLMGIYTADTGSILFGGKKLEIDGPASALNAGLSMIHQELSPLPDMTIAENLFLGRELKKGPFLDKKEMIRQADELLKNHGMGDISSTLPMNCLSVAKMQMVEIIKAASYDSSLIVMDEPTSSLSSEEVNELFRVIKLLKEKGVSIVYISHRMEEIFILSDTITVLRDGQTIATVPTSDISKTELIQMMVGREISQVFPKTPAEIGEVVLEVKNLTRHGVFEDISFTARRGEILGISGLVGAGRSEIVRAIFGVDELDSGEIWVDGKQVEIKKPLDAINAGFGLVTEDRKELGLVLCLGIKDNISLPNLNLISATPFVSRQKETAEADKMAKLLAVKMSGLDQIVENLSGGNQQKVVIAKWLQRKPKILILDEPTRGIDVGAKSEIHRLMSQLAGEGMVIIMISSEMPEILGMSDRVIVIGNGRVKGEFDRSEATQEAILTKALQ